MSDYLLFGAFALVALAGFVLAVLQLPGNWLILAAAAAYDWRHDWDVIGWKWLAGLAVFAALIELVEFGASAFVVSRSGASRRASIGALIGGLAGMLLLTVPIPIPLVGTVAGGLVGCFVGALVGEMSVRDDLRNGARVGVFAVIGRLLGMLIKTSSAVVIAGTTVSLAAWDLFL